MEVPDHLLEKLAQMMQLGIASGCDLSDLAQAHEEVGKKFEELDRVRAAAIFGGLLTVPELHSNSLRLEAMVALSGSILSTSRFEGPFDGYRSRTSCVKCYGSSRSDRCCPHQL
jgi:hypothetical protein